MSSDANREFAGTVRLFRWQWAKPVAMSAALVALTTIVLWFAEARLNHEHLIFLYLAPTALIAILYGSVSAIGVMLASSAAAAYFLYPPRFSLVVAGPLEMLELALFCVLALLASRVVAGLGYRP
jgi:K+-sensing histidine kinase KdpD